jgi:hypothetical protein
MSDKVKIVIQWVIVVSALILSIVALVKSGKAVKTVTTTTTVLQRDPVVVIEDLKDVEGPVQVKVGFQPKSVKAQLLHFTLKNRFILGQGEAIQANIVDAEGKNSVGIVQYGQVVDHQGVNSYMETSDSSILKWYDYTGILIYEIRISSFDADGLTYTVVKPFLAPQVKVRLEIA